MVDVVNKLPAIKLLILKSLKIVGFFAIAAVRDPSVLDI